MAESVPLVEVRKGGEILRVHPTTVAAHAAVGWLVATDAEPDPEPIVPARRPRPKRTAKG